MWHPTLPAWPPPDQRPRSATVGTAARVAAGRGDRLASRRLRQSLSRTLPTEIGPIKTSSSAIVDLTCLFAGVLVSLAGAARSAPPDVAADPRGLASFTRVIQPLLLNRCAAGACHGGRQSPEPQFTRGPARGMIGRPTTLANLKQLTAAAQQAGTHADFFQTVLTRHADEPGLGRPTAGLLTTGERQLLATWLAAFASPPPDRSGRSGQIADDGTGLTVYPAGFDQSAGPSRENRGPNRLQTLLEEAANPPQLPPPRVTKGLDLDSLLPEAFPPLPPADGEQPPE